MVVLRRDVAYGETLTAGVVALEDRELKSLDGYLASLESVVGSVARKKMASGEVLYCRDVEEAVMVRRGDTVTLVARGPRFALSTTAQARDSGRRGEAISVVNLDSRQVVQARVVDAGVVETLVSGSKR